MPEFAGITKEILRYERGDGVPLAATLYLPAAYDHERDGPLPTVFWVYPEEFASRDAAGQVTTSPNTFSRPFRDSVLYLLTQGYAVVVNPSLPIVGEAGAEPNDTYIEQLVAGMEAAIDVVADRGVADRDRLLVGGHSYGAFTVAHLLAHTDLFRAGIARSGAYNRTLTPFGFQGEQRTFWQAPDTYMRLSPFTHAAQIDEPLLLIHGEADSNPGTYPIQSERLYEAMRGLGGTVRLVMLPHEEHGYQSREAIAHVLWEMVRWGDQYVKSPE
jgi:dipeptidyl aminopeptidase/acylaminoacyl peptidase